MSLSAQPISIRKAQSRDKSPHNFAHLANFSKYVSDMFDIHAILFLWLSNLSHVLVTWSGFLALFTWSRRTTRAKDHRIFLAKEINEVGKFDHMERFKEINVGNLPIFLTLKHVTEFWSIKLFTLPIREFQGLCNWTTMLHIQQATSLPPNFSIKKATMDRSWFAIYLLLLKFLLHLCSLLFCICANEKTVIMTKTTT